MSKLSVMSEAYHSSCHSKYYEWSILFQLTWTWPVYVRVVRRLVTLISRLAQVQADFEAAQRQAESASAAAKQFMEDKENKVKAQHTVPVSGCLVVLRSELFFMPIWHVQWTKICQRWWSTKPINILSSFTAEYKTVYICWKYWLISFMLAFSIGFLVYKICSIIYVVSVSSVWHCFCWKLDVIP